MSMTVSEGKTGSDGGSKPRLLLCGHTYALEHNRAKAEALARYFEVGVATMEVKGWRIMGRAGEEFEQRAESNAYALFALRRRGSDSARTRLWLQGLGRVVKEFRPDIVLCEAEPWSVLRWQTWFAVRRHCRTAMFGEFTWENLRRPGWKGVVLDRVYRAVGRTTQFVICGNEAAKGLMMRGGVAENRILVAAQLGIDPAQHPVADDEAKRQWRTSMGWDGGSRVVGFCGRFVAEKGIGELIEAMDSLQERLGHLKLALLGGGPLEASLRDGELARPWLEILPPRPHSEVGQFLQHLDVLVLPSKPRSAKEGGLWEEQFGKVLVEAMASEVPAIGSTSGAIPDVVGEPEAIFPWGDAGALARCLENLLASPEKANELARRQRERALSLCSHENLARRYAEFIQSRKAALREAALRAAGEKV